MSFLHLSSSKQRNPRKRRRKGVNGPWTQQEKRIKLGICQHSIEKFNRINALLNPCKSRALHCIALTSCSSRGSMKFNPRTSGIFSARFHNKCCFLTIGPFQLPHTPAKGNFTPEQWILEMRPCCLWQIQSQERRSRALAWVINPSILYIDVFGWVDKLMTWLGTQREELTTSPIPAK